MPRAHLYTTLYLLTSKQHSVLPSRHLFFFQRSKIPYIEKIPFFFPSPSPRSTIQIPVNHQHVCVGSANGSIDGVVSTRRAATRWWCITITHHINWTFRHVHGSHPSRFHCCRRRWWRWHNPCRRRTSPDIFPFHIPSPSRTVVVVASIRFAFSV